MTRVYRHIQFALLGLAACAWCFELSDADLWLQDLFYNFNTHQWLVDRHDHFLRTLFYDGPKALLTSLALLLLIGLLALGRRPGLAKYRGGLLLLLLALLVVPGTITSLKNMTNVACPAAITRYDGDIPYIKVFDHYPTGQQPAQVQRCFPAGHASGGFALLALFYLPLQRRNRYLALASAMAIGSAMGGYKMLIGHHFLSHTLVTALLSWLLIHLVILMLPARWRPLPLELERGGDDVAAAYPVLTGMVESPRL
jgi:membrane-associated PAP2 superfamily phosphatase